MKVALFSKTFPEEHIEYLQLIVRLLEKKSAGISFFEPFFSKIKTKIAKSSSYGLFNNYDDVKGSVDYIFSIGGDGTLLDTLSLVRDSGIPVMGINLGRMGFLSSISKERIEVAIEMLGSGKYRLDERSLIKLNTKPELFPDLNYALNEVSFYRQSPLSMLKIQTWVDDEFLNSYWGDGLIVSTPTGSTAYSLSNGGPIIMPGSSNFVITPIATHNLTVRPVVIPDSSKIRVKIVGRIKDFYVNLDSRSAQTNAATEFEISKESFRLNLLQLEDESYFRTIREKLMWGLDIRN